MYSCAANAFAAQSLTWAEAIAIGENCWEALHGLGRGVFNSLIRGAVDEAEGAAGQAEVIDFVLRGN